MVCDPARQCQHTTYHEQLPPKLPDEVSIQAFRAPPVYPQRTVGSHINHLVHAVDIVPQTLPLQTMVPTQEPGSVVVEVSSPQRQTQQAAPVVEPGREPTAEQVDEPVAMPVDFPTASSASDVVQVDMPTAEEMEELGEEQGDGAISSTAGQTEDTLTVEEAVNLHAKAGVPLQHEANPHLQQAADDGTSRAGSTTPQGPGAAGRPAGPRQQPTPASARGP